MLEFQSEIDRVLRETSEATSRRDVLAKSIKDKEQVQIVLGKTQISKTKYCVAGANALLPQVLEGTNAAVHEAAAKLEEKRAEEASGRAALAETYARIRELESKIAVGLAVKSDEVIKEQQLVRFAPVSH
jgi:hypothetical protein